MGQAYRIVGWERAHEVSQSKRYNSISWVACRNSHTGRGFRRIMRLANGRAVFGAYILLVELSSRLPADLRGWILSTAMEVYGAEDLAEIVGGTTEEWESHLNTLCDPKIGWLTVEAIPDVLRAKGVSLGACSVEIREKEREERRSPYGDPVRSGNPPSNKISSSEVTGPESLGNKTVRADGVPPKPGVARASQVAGPDRKDGKTTLSGKGTSSPKAARNGHPGITTPAGVRSRELNTLTQRLEGSGETDKTVLMPDHRKVAPRAWVGQFVVQVSDRLGLDSQQAISQRRAFGRVGYDLLKLDDPNFSATHLCNVAGQVRSDPSVDHPARLWQHKATAYLAEKGLRNGQG